ncbi:pentapeptide repeat-containing protein [Azospirillum sp.]|uniref:pentapeptide repeat-containing protein n=1 Tax=Azospirillum sp. TaxID=34012 RepID=UPI002D313C89|nr:pentapeptide repeat-containing protein [Azospirillum sp.]HYD70355.1 pentapeptide repeat-containing protein [Azospirillum sp.]
MSERTQAEIETIKAALMGHQNWLKRKGGKRADLSFKNLSGLNLEKMNLSGAKLSGATFVGSRLAGADLSQTDLFGADLEGANLTGANLAGADLRGANLHRAALTDAILRGADLRAGAIMSDGGAAKGGGQTKLTEAKLERSILNGANFAGCDLSGADLNDADLSGAELTGAVLVGTDLAGATLDGATFGNTVIDAAALSQTYIPFALPANALAQPTYREVAAADFLAMVVEHERWVETEGREGKRLDADLLSVTGSDIGGRILSAARLRRCRFPRAKWRGVDLQMADLSYTDLEGADLAEADLRGATLRRARLAAAKLGKADARPLHLAGGRAWPANFDSADLSFADLRGAQMAEAVTGSAKMDGAKLDGSGLSVPETTGAAPPPRPTSPTERRRHKRFSRPVLMLQDDRGAHHSRNWSVAGLCVRVYDQENPYQPGEVIRGRLILGDRMDVTAPVECTVIRNQVAKGQVSLKFNGMNDELKTLLKIAFADYQRLTSG